MSERRQDWECYQLLHGGEGPRGERVTVLGCGVWYDAEEAARHAAEYFDDEEMRRERMFHDDFDDGFQTVEVCEDRSDCPGRIFEVRCEVVRKYTATERVTTDN